MNLPFTNYTIEESNDGTIKLSLPFKDNYRHFVGTGTFGNLVAGIPDLEFIDFKLEHGILEFTARRK